MEISRSAYYDAPPVASDDTAIVETMSAIPFLVAKQYAIGHRIVITEQLFNEQFRIDFQCTSPYPVAIGRHPPAPSLQLRNKRIVLGTHQSG